jgi:hypothetical protein
VGSYPGGRDRVGIDPGPITIAGLGQPEKRSREKIDGFNGCRQPDLNGTAQQCRSH